MRAACIAGACWLLGAPPAGAQDTFAPLERYNGAWTVQSGTGKVTRLENHCSRTGRFFECEQAVNGQTKALIVFQLEGEVGRSRTYLIQTLQPGESVKPRPWNHLTIEGDRWVYGAAVDEDKAHPLRNRTVNEFSGPDHIHFEIQSSKDGKIWKTLQSGDEQREAAAK